MTVRRVASMSFTTTPASLKLIIDFDIYSNDNQFITNNKHITKTTTISFHEKGEIPVFQMMSDSRKR